ncbi:hypothetical protein C8R45DRAFT_1087582 [Mycena sanguinolenta]|nr:hypothetical protein C8R45DRAFT_1087582 [Mycena sanguinolenta]
MEQSRKAVNGRLRLTVYGQTRTVPVPYKIVSHRLTARVRNRIYGPCLRNFTARLQALEEWGGGLMDSQKGRLEIVQALYEQALPGARILWRGGQVEAPSVRARCPAVPIPRSPGNSLYSVPPRPPALRESDDHHHVDARLPAERPPSPSVTYPVSPHYFHPRAQLVFAFRSLPVVALHSRHSPPAARRALLLFLS